MSAGEADPRATHLDEAVLDCNGKLVPADEHPLDAIDRHLGYVKESCGEIAHTDPVHRALGHLWYALRAVEKHLRSLPPPASQPKVEPAGPWRTGHKQSRNLYFGDNYRGVMFDESDARGVVAAMNNPAAHPSLPGGLGLSVEEWEALEWCVDHCDRVAPRRLAIDAFRKLNAREALESRARGGSEGERSPKTLPEMYAAIEGLCGAQNMTLSSSGNTITIQFDGEPTPDSASGRAKCTRELPDMLATTCPIHGAGARPSPEMAGFDWNERFLAAEGEPDAIATLSGSGCAYLIEPPPREQGGGDSGRVTVSSKADASEAEEDGARRMRAVWHRGELNPAKDSWHELGADDRGDWIRAYRFVRAESEGRIRELEMLLGNEGVRVRDREHKLEIANSERDGYKEQLAALKAEKEAVRSALCKLTDVEPDTGETTLEIVGLVERDREHLRRGKEAAEARAVAAYELLRKLHVASDEAPDLERGFRVLADGLGEVFTTLKPETAIGASHHPIRAPREG